MPASKRKFDNHNNGGDDHDDDEAVPSYASGDDDLLDSDVALASWCSPSEVATFTYEKLNPNSQQIRILLLEPSQNQREPVRCLLTFASLGKCSRGDQPRFAALSYAWGGSNRSHVILIDGHPFPVTHNLYAGLRCLRQKKDAIRLWIDAICVNQNDIHEKSHQVGMMRDIYRSATGVIVWLGESDRDIRKAILFLGDVQRGEENSILDRLSDANVYERYALGLGKIFNKPWFSRLWVVQEILVARVPPLALCGHKWILWANLISAMVSTALADTQKKRLFKDPITRLFFAVLAARSGLDVGSRFKSLEKLLIGTSDRETSLPHDKIYALLALLPSIPKDLQPDYGQPLSIVFQQAMVHLLKLTHNFLTNVLKRQSSELPSWCIDFSNPNWNGSTGDFGLTHIHDMKGATGDVRKSRIMHEPRSRLIELMGFFIGQVNTVTKSKCKPPGGALIVITADFVRLFRLVAKKS
jgi:hypothetical protein